MRPPRDPAKGKPSTRIGETRQRGVNPLLTLTQRVVVSHLPRRAGANRPSSGGCFSMADSLAARLSLDDVRASVKRAQTEGRKLVTRLRKDATAMVNRPPLDVLSDARKRANKAVEQIDAQQRRLRTIVIDRLTGLAGQAASRVGLASAQDVADLKRRLGDLERRLDRVSKHQAA